MRNGAHRLRFIGKIDNVTLNRRLISPAQFNYEILISGFSREIDRIDEPR